MSNTNTAHNMPRSTAIQAPDAPRYEIQETPLAFFSTEGGRYPARKVDHANLPPTLARTDKRADKEKMVKELRKKWPHECYGIFARSSQGHLQWHLPWFFDEYDAVVHGASFLYEVILTIQKQNELAATKYIDEWGASNESKWSEIDFDQLTWDRAFADFDLAMFGEEFLKVCFRQMKAKWDGAKDVMQRQAEADFLKHRMAQRQAPEVFGSQLNAGMPAFAPQTNLGIPFMPHLAHGSAHHQQAAFIGINGGPYLQSYDGHVANFEPHSSERQPLRGGRGYRGKLRGGRRSSASSEHDHSASYTGGSSFAAARRDSFGRRPSVSDTPPASQTLARRRTESLTKSYPAMEATQVSRWNPEDLAITFNRVGKGINYLKVLNLGFIPPNTSQKDMCEALEGVGLSVEWVAIHAPKDDAGGDPFGSAGFHSTDDVRKGLRMKTVPCKDVELTLSISKRFMRTGHEGPEYIIPGHRPPMSAYHPPGRSYSPQDARSSQDVSPQQSRRGSFTSQDIVRSSSPIKHIQRGRLESNTSASLEVIAEEAVQGKKDAVSHTIDSNGAAEDIPNDFATPQEETNLDHTRAEAAGNNSRTDTEALIADPLSMEKGAHTASKKPPELHPAEHTRSAVETPKSTNTAHKEESSSAGSKPMKLSVNLGQRDVTAGISHDLASSVPHVPDLSALGGTMLLSRSANTPTITAAPQEPLTKELSLPKHPDREKAGSEGSIGKEPAMSAKSDRRADTNATLSDQAAASKTAIPSSKSTKAERTPVQQTAAKANQQTTEWTVVTPKKGAQAAPQPIELPSSRSYTVEAAARPPVQEISELSASASAEPTGIEDTPTTSKFQMAITPADSPPSTPASLTEHPLPPLSPWKEDYDDILRVLETLTERQQRDSGSSLMNIRGGLEKIEKSYEDVVAKLQGGSKTMRKGSRQKLKKLCDKQKDVLEDLHLLDLQIGQMVGTDLTLDELQKQREEDKTKPKSKADPKPASSKPEVKQTKLDSEGTSVRKQPSPQPSILTSAGQQPKASQWPFFNMYTGTPDAMFSLLSAPSQSYAVDEHGIDSQISFSPLAQTVLQGKDAWERDHPPSDANAELRKDLETMNFAELRQQSETADTQASNAAAFEKEVKKIQQQHEASASDDISSPTAVGSNTTIEDVSSNNGKEAQAETGEGKQSAYQAQTQEGQRPSMRGGSIDAAQASRPSYASAARSSSRPIIPALPKGIVRRTGEDKGTNASGEWRVREGEDWSKSGEFKKGG